MRMEEPPLQVTGKMRIMNQMKAGASRPCHFREKSMRGSISM